MSSRKPSARAKRVKEFKAQLDGAYYPGETDGSSDPFAREARRTRELSAKKETALRLKACESKNRYATAFDAQCAIDACASYGTTGLHSYKCPYCNGWHLTSKPKP